MTRNELRARPLLLAAILLAGSAIVERAAAGDAPIVAHAPPKIAKPAAPRNLLGRRISPPVAPQRVQPNAIGVLVEQQRHEGAIRGTAYAIHSPAPMIGGTSGVGPATQGAGLQSPSHPQFHTTPTVNPIVQSRPAISGTGVAHPRSGPAVVGGPARTVVGINGTAIRPKH
jgi:hypothetical protein